MISEFILNSKQKFEAVMGKHDSLPQPTLPAPFTEKRSKGSSIINPIPAVKAQFLYQALRTKEVSDPSEDDYIPLGSKVFQERFRKLKLDPSNQPNVEQQCIIDKYIRFSSLPSCLGLS